MKPAPGTPYEETPCAKCVYAESRFIGHGRNVSFDDGGAANRIGMTAGGGMVFDGEQIVAADDAGEPADVAAPDAEGDGVDPVRLEMMDTFRAFLLDLADFPPPRLYAAFQLLKNRPLIETAAELGCTFQNVHGLQNAALRKLPILRALVRRVTVRKSAKAQSGGAG